MKVPLSVRLASVALVALWLANLPWLNCYPAKKSLAWLASEVAW